MLFDLGGTLIDYLGGAASWPAMELPGVHGLHACLTTAGFTMEEATFADSFVHTIEDRWRAAIHDAADPPILASLIDEACFEAGLQLSHELRQQAISSFCGPIAERCLLADGAPEVVRWLHESGVRLVLISNSIWPGEMHRRDLQRHGLLQYFDATLFSTETGLWKPDPRVFERALTEVGVAADEAAFVGDQLVEDIGGAKRVGLRTIQIGGTPQNLDGTGSESIQPDASIRSLWELPEVLLRLAN
jgi:putative hydrolase of the HAD superfamily